MALSQLSRGKIAASSSRAAAPSLPARRPLVVLAKASNSDDVKQAADRVKQAAMAGVLATSLLLGSGLVAPDEAFAARSGGRVSSSGFSSRRAAPSRAA